jgi:dCTP deaminase
MILSDRDILHRLEDGDLAIEPLADLDLQIQPASVDLRLGSEFLEFQRTNISCIHPDDEREVEEYITETVVEEGADFILHPGDFVLGTTKERVEVPPDLIAHVQGRSSMGRLAVVIHATAGIIDPGYRGQITLELSNLGTAPVRSRRECASHRSFSPSCRRRRSAPTVPIGPRSTRTSPGHRPRRSAATVSSGGGQ